MYAAIISAAKKTFVALEIMERTTEQLIKDICKYLPEDQHEEAEYRIRRAILDGVEAIGLCTYDKPPHVDDLMGNQEGEPAEINLGPEHGKVTITRWATWLYKYRSQ